MQRALKDPAFKVRLFRFVHAYPTLRTPAEVLDHLGDELSQAGVSAALAAWRLANALAAATIAAQITAMAQTFIAGQDLEAAEGRLRRLWDQSLACCLDLQGDTCLSHDEADAFAQRIGGSVLHAPGFEAALDRANGLAPQAHRWGVHLPAWPSGAGPAPAASGRFYLNRGITGAVVGRHPFSEASAAQGAAARLEAKTVCCISCGPAAVPRISPGEDFR